MGSGKSYQGVLTVGVHQLVCLVHCKEDLLSTCWLRHVVILVWRIVVIEGLANMGQRDTKTLQRHGIPVHCRNFSKVKYWQKIEIIWSTYFGRIDHVISPLSWQLFRYELKLCKTITYLRTDRHSKQHLPMVP